MAPIDKLIDNLSGAGYSQAIDDLISIGEPSLRRLMQVIDGTLRMPLRSKDEVENRQEALIRLGRLHKEAFLNLIHEDPKRKDIISVIWALGFIDDDRVIDILIEALQKDNAFLGFAAHMGLNRRGDPRGLEALAQSEPPLIHLLPPRQPPGRPPGPR